MLGWGGHSFQSIRENPATTGSSASTALWLDVIAQRLRQGIKSHESPQLFCIIKEAFEKSKKKKKEVLHNGDFFPPAAARKLIPTEAR